MVRKAHEPTEKDRKQVMLMAGIGLTHDQIAKIIGISDETLRKYYDQELSVSASMMNAQVAQNLYSIATGKGPGSVPAAIFWMKTRGGWKEVERKEVSGPNGAPISLASVNLRGLNDQELENMHKLLEKAAD